MLGEAMKQANLTEVAKLAGVSISTASRILNSADGTIPISENTRQKVLSAAKQLGYVPSAAARILRMGASRTIGVLGTSAEFFRHIGTYGGSSFSNESMSGLMDAALRHGYHVTLLTGLRESEGLLQDLGVIDGLLVLNHDLSKYPDPMALLDAFAKPIVYIFDYPPQSVYSAPDDSGGAKVAVEQLLKAGHRDIGFVRKAEFKALFDRRQKGWADALQSAGITPRPEWLIELSDSNELRSLPPITAAICSNQGTFQRFHTQVQALGLRVPDDISIVTFGHKSSPVEELNASRVVVSVSDIVAYGVTALIHLVEGEGKENLSRLFAYEFKPGITVGSLT
jgi:LacI family transcriptional regulator